MLEDIKDQSKRYHIIYSTSERATDFVIDKLKEQIEEVMTSYNDNQLKEMIKQATTPPFFSSEWLCIAEIDKRQIYTVQRFLKGIKSGYGVFLFITNQYSDFKKIKEILPSEQVNTIYLSNLSRKDISWVLGSLSTKMPEVVYNYCCKNYAKNIDAILDLKKHLETNTITTKKELEDICGLPDADYIKWVCALAKGRVGLTETNKDYDKETKRITKNLLSKFIPFCEMKTPQYLHTIFENTLRDCILIKQDYITASFYTRDDLPNQYKKYGRHFEEIKKTPLPVFVDLYKSLTQKKRWDNIEDVYGYIFDHYARRERRII